MTRRVVVRICLFVAALAAAVPSAAPAAASGSHAVQMAHYSFSPQSLTISVGDAVTWTNQDTAPHDVTTSSGPISLHSPTLQKSQSWTYEFTTPGTYSYYCSIHPDMRATLIVQQAPATQAAPPAPLQSNPNQNSIAKTPTRTFTLPPSQAVVVQPPRNESSGGVAAPEVAPTATASPVDPPSTMGPAAQATSSVATAPPLRPLLLLTGLIVCLTVFCLLAVTGRRHGSTAK